MEKLCIKSFKGLDHTNDLLRLDWFGGIAPNLDEPDNPLIDCYFTPLPITKSKYPPHQYKPIRSIKDQIRATISVGYLPTLWLGQYFRSGKLEPLCECPTHETITFELDTSDPLAVIDSSLPNSYFNLISYKHLPSAGHSGIKELNGLLLQGDDSISSEAINDLPAPFTIYIHEMELIRFYLTNSEFSCKRIFTGAFQNHRLFTDVFNAIHEVPWRDPKTRTGRFVYRHGYKQADALSLGRILFESEDHGLKAAQQVYKQIIIDRINYTNGWIGYPKTNFPFKGVTQLQVYGRRLKVKAGFIFFVHRIDSCSAPFPFRHLSYCDEIARGGEPAPDNADVAFSGPKSVNKGPAHAEDDIGNSVSDQQPDSRAARLETQFGTRNFLDLKNITQESIKIRNCTHRSSQNFSQNISNLINSSTGGATTGGSNAAPQTITARNISPSTVSPDLDTFCKIMKSIRILKISWKVTTFCVGHGLKDKNGEWHSYFPTVRCNKKSSLHQFSFMDKAKLKTKRFIAVEININNQYLYLFEAQRQINEKFPQNKQSYYKNGLSILLLYKTGFSKCVSNDFNYMLKKTVVKSTWPSQNQLTDFIKDNTVHGHGAKSTDQMASRVIDLITRNTQR